LEGVKLSSGGRGRKERNPEEEEGKKSDLTGGREKVRGRSGRERKKARSTEKSSSDQLKWRTRGPQLKKGGGGVFRGGTVTP